MRNLIKIFILLAGVLYIDGEVQALWFGVDISKDIPAGQYQGFVTIEAKDTGIQKIKLRLTVRNKVIVDRGDGEPWRHSRLRWLDSKIALNKDYIPPFNPVMWHQKNGHKIIQCLGRELTTENTEKNSTAGIN